MTSNRRQARGKLGGLCVRDCSSGAAGCFKAAFHDTDILARILADTSDTRDFLQLFLWQAERGSRPTPRHPRDDPREDVGEDVGIGVVECGLYRVALCYSRVCCRVWAKSYSWSENQITVRVSRVRVNRIGLVGSV